MRGCSVGCLDMTTFKFALATTPTESESEPSAHVSATAEIEGP